VTDLLSVELLESRRLLSTFTVLNLADSGEGSLRQAILDANAEPGPDAIEFADELVGSIVLSSGQLSVTDDLTIDGPGADELAVSGNQQSRVFGISGGATVAIDGLTIRDGNAVGSPALGGGILNNGSRLTLTRAVLSDNVAAGASGAMARGGAIANLSGAALTVTDCLFTQNQAIGGSNGQGLGGAIDTTGSALAVNHSSFVGNRAAGGAVVGRSVPSSGGGGISARPDNTNQPSTVTVSQSTFVGNQAVGGDGGIIDGTAAFQSTGGGAGGGIRIGGRSTVTVEDTAFTGNRAIGGNRGSAASTARDYDISFGYGGGVLNFAGTLVVRGSTFTGNQAIGGSHATGLFGRGHVGDGSGGGLINLDGGTATVTDSTFDHNEARGGDDNVGGTSLTGGRGAFIVGWGLGGAITNEGWNRGTGTSMTASNLTLTHNRAVGGEGNTGNVLAGAGVGGGLASWWVAAPVTIRDSTVAHNQAVGGSGADGLGGGLANVLGSSMTVVASAVDKNLALGGDGADGSDGGDGLGGGAYNGAASSLRIERSTVMKNHANGGTAGSDGEGIGGGVYNLGLFSVDELTVIRKNRASTNHDDIFSSAPFA
jgi:hypothetical protein